MRVKLAAKMPAIAWTLMKKRQMFDPGCIGNRLTINGGRARWRPLRRYDLARDNDGPLTLNHAAGIKDDRWSHDTPDTDNDEVRGFAS
jgi:hypothetical protein